MSGRIITFFLYTIACSIWHISLHAQETEPIYLMQPKGPFQVGHVMLDWTDPTRKEPATADPNDLRQVPVQIWYPARKDSPGERAAYRPRVEAFRSTWGDETVDMIKAIKTLWIEAAEISPNGPFAVFVFSHGWGARSSSHGTFLSNLASNGYIVVGLNHPFMGKIALSNLEITEPSDSQFPTQDDANRFYSDDVIFAINQLSNLNEQDPIGRFTGTMDLKRISAGGHSSGFPAASGAAVRDPRIKALVSFDSGVPRAVRDKGLDVPIFLFRAETESYTDLFFRGEHVHPKGTIYDVNFFRVMRADFYDLVISGTTHQSCYDEYLFAEKKEERDISLRNHQLFGMYTAAFLEKALRGVESTLLQDSVSKDPISLRFIPAFRH